MYDLRMRLTRHFLAFHAGVKIGRAKQLMNADFKKIADVAEAEPQQLTKVIQYLSKEKVRVLMMGMNRHVARGWV